MTKKNLDLSPWVYNGREIQDSDIDGYAGFVYLIEDLETGVKYIGRKYFTSIRKQKKSTSTRRKRQESDWRDYYSSSDELKEMVEYAEDRSRFKRTILVLCKTEGDTNYMETKLLFDFNVLEDDTFINGNILGKYMKKPQKIIEHRTYSSEFELLKTTL